MFVSRKAAFALPAVLILTLGGCSLLEPSGTNVPLTGIAACALGHTWTQNFEPLKEQITATLSKRGINPTGVTFTGDQTMTWDDKAHMVITSNYSVAVTTPETEDRVLTVTETHSGTASGAAYINGDVAIPRKWDDKFSIAAVADISGEPLDPSYSIPATDFDDAVGLILTCDADTLTISPRGSQLTQTWTLVK